jgi:hypothetical protein
MLLTLNGCSTNRQPFNMKCGTIEIPPLPALPVSKLNTNSSNSEVVKAYVATVQILIDDRKNISYLINS